MKKILFNFAPDGKAEQSTEEQSTDTNPNTEPAVKDDAETFYGEKPDGEVQLDGEPEKDKPEVKEEDAKEEEKPDAKEEQADPKKDESTDGKVEEVDYGKLEAGEGFEIPDKAIELFKELGTDLEGSQKLVAFSEKLQQDAITSAHDAKVEAWGKALDADESIADADMVKANEFLSKHAGDELNKALKEEGFHAHPAMAKFVIKLAKSISEDSLLNGDSFAKSYRPTDAEVFYGNK